MEEVFVREADAVFEFGLVRPAQGGGFAHIEKLARRTVGTGGVPLDLALVAHDLGHQLRQGLDGQFLAGAGVDGLVAGVVIHQEDAEVGEVIDIEELS